MFPSLIKNKRITTAKYLVDGKREEEEGERVLQENDYKMIKLFKPKIKVKRLRRLKSVFFQQPSVLKRRAVDLTPVQF